MPRLFDAAAVSKAISGARENGLRLREKTGAMERAFYLLAELVNADALKN